MANERPYDGLLVVSLEQAVAAPLCSAHFAQGGARVIKIERDTGDFARKYDTAVKGSASYFVWANAGKQSLCLDIKSPEDARLLHRILAQADVFIQNLAPGAAQRAGFGSDELRARYPRLITSDISGYGESGDYREMKAYDFLVQCESGLVAVNGAPDAMGRVGVSICDIAASKDAIIGIQQALYRREKSGQGAGVKVSLFDTTADLMTVPLMHADYGEGAPKPAGLKHPSIAPYGGFETIDGRVLAISVQNEREWHRLCKTVFEAPEMAIDARFKDAKARVQNRNVLDAMIAAFFIKHTAQDLKRRLSAAKIAFGAVNAVQDVLNHPQLRRAGVVLENGESADLIAPPVQYSYDDPADDFARDLGRIPAIGAHSDRIREEFGN